MRRVGVVDICSGNVRSVVRATEAAAAMSGIAYEVSWVTEPRELAALDVMIVPGQGALGTFMAQLVAKGFEAPLRAHLAAGKPYLGICLGMQALYEHSEEQPEPGAATRPGLGVLRGTVRKLAASATRKVPHMGWNQLAWRPSSLAERLAEGLDPNPAVYFVHSYACQPTDATEVLAAVDYEGEVCAAVARDNIVAVQFHPEKSQREGLCFLRNVLRWASDAPRVFGIPSAGAAGDTATAAGGANVLPRAEQPAVATRPAGLRVYPAIDLLDGAVVRLREGKRELRTDYPHAPLELARAYASAGAELLHVVDLNGAFDGDDRQHRLLAELVEHSGLPLQLGGGIRTLAQAEKYLALGVRRLVLGTVAIAEPELAARLCAQFPGQIVIAVDARDGLVATHGWTQASELTATELCKRAEAMGAAAVLYTDIARDGTGRGVNVEATAALARTTSLEVIASGGVHSLDDLRRLAAASVPATVIGRALLDGTFRLSDALAVAARGHGRQADADDAGGQSC